LVLWISEITRLWYCGKIYGFRTVQRRFQYASKKESLERTHREDAVIERIQALISDDPGQLASIDVSEPTMRRIAEEDLRYKSYTLKIRQMLSSCQDKSYSPPILVSQQLRIKSLGLLWSVVERVKQVSIFVMSLRFLTSCVGHVEIVTSEARNDTLIYVAIFK